MLFSNSAHSNNPGPFHNIGAWSRIVRLVEISNSNKNNSKKFKFNWTIGGTPYVNYWLSGGSSLDGNIGLGIAWTNRITHPSKLIYFVPHLKYSFPTTVIPQEPILDYGQIVLTSSIQSDRIIENSVYFGERFGLSNSDFHVSYGVSESGKKTEIAASANLRYDTPKLCAMLKAATVSRLVGFTTMYSVSEFSAIGAEVFSSLTEESIGFALGGEFRNKKRNHFHETEAGDFVSSATISSFGNLETDFTLQATPNLAISTGIELNVFNWYSGNDSLVDDYSIGFHYNVYSDIGKRIDSFLHETLLAKNYQFVLSRKNLIGMIHGSSYKGSSQWALSFESTPTRLKRAISGSSSITDIASIGLSFFHSF